jgi:hypothetical protein
MGFHEQEVTGKSHTKPVATFITVTIFALSGVFNALLYRLTRASIFQGSPEDEPRAPPIRDHAIELGQVAGSRPQTAFDPPPLESA